MSTLSFNDDHYDEDMDEKEPAPPPDTTFTRQTGLLAPDGRFFPCEYEGHSALYRKLKRDYGYPARWWDDVSAGFMHLSDGSWRNIDHYVGGCFRPTQSQVDYVAQWISSNNKIFPTWLKKKLDSGLLA